MAVTQGCWGPFYHRGHWDNSHRSLGMAVSQAGSSGALGPGCRSPSAGLTQALPGDQGQRPGTGLEFGS
jgi:hypothetical protein